MSLRRLTAYSALFIICSARITSPHFVVLCNATSAQCKVSSASCIAYSLQITDYSAQCTVHSVKLKFYSLYCSALLVLLQVQHAKGSNFELFSDSLDPRKTVQCA